MFELINKILTGLLTGLVNRSSHIKCVLLSDQKCMVQPTFDNLHPNEYNQKLHYYPFAVKLSRCVESFNILNNLSNKVCVLNKTEDLNIHVFHMIAGKIELEILTKDISCKCKCKLDGRKCNSNQKWNNDKYRCECKKHICVKDYICNPSTCRCKNGKYKSLIDSKSLRIRSNKIDGFIRVYDVTRYLPSRYSS